MKKLFLLFLIFFLLAVQTVSAQRKTPVMIQGVAISSDGVPLHNGNKTVTFTIYDSPDGGAALWSEQQIIPIEDGRFKAALGASNSLDLAFDQPPYWLGMKIDSGEELKPRIELNDGGVKFKITSQTDISQSGGKGNGNGPVDMDPAGGATIADQQILDDLIVDGSICAGFDCVNGESFGFDTIRLKENNLRIKAEDTSNSASFPTNDWQITFNSSANGGGNYFAIDDIDGGRTPFLIEAGAPSHSLYVDDAGRIGLGTNQPVVEIHVKDGDSPTLRLEQDGSSGFGPQTWDLAGNETNFFIRDATNGSKLPFRIRPNAPSNSIYVDTDGDIGMGNSAPFADLHINRNNPTYSLLIGANAADTDPGTFVVQSDGNVGIGTTVPAAALHLLRTSGNVDMRIEGAGTNSRVGIRLHNDVQNWRILCDGVNGDAFQIIDATASGGPARLTIDLSGRVGIGRTPLANVLEVEGDASKTTVGDWLANSDRRLKEDIQEIENGLATINKLRPVQFRYNEIFKAKHPSTKDRVYYNFIAQEYQEIFPESVQDDGEGYLQVDTYNTRPYLVKAVQELSTMVDDLQAENTTLKAEYSAMNSRLAKIEALLQKPAAVQTVRSAAFRKPSANVSASAQESEIDENGRALGSTPQN